MEIDIKKSDLDGTPKNDVRKLSEPILKQDLPKSITTLDPIEKPLFLKEKEIKPKKKIFEVFDLLKPWQNLLLILGVGLLNISILIFSVWTFVIRRPLSPSQIIAFDGNYIEPIQIGGDSFLISKYLIPLLDPTMPKTEVSPLNGELFTKTEMQKLLERRPVAIMINNHVQARPQSGLSQADIVYETVAEGGITRYMAVFWNQLPNKVGPIRSARQYYLEWLSEFDPIYIHDGCASTSDPRTNACGNIITYNIKDMYTAGAWRVSDRYAPHNEYSSAAYAIEYAKKQNWGAFNTGVDPLKFKRDASLEERGQKTRVKIRFRDDLSNGGAYDSEWNYDQTTNLYRHKIGGSADYDLENKQAITAKVVIIQEVPMQDAQDGHARVIITTTGEGKVVILQDGKIINGKWKKESRTARTKYYDGSGKEIELNRGLLWITALPKEKGSFDILEQ